MKAPGPIVFFGTPDFSVPSLEALCRAEMVPILVVSQPSRPVGRGRHLQRPPVAERAAELGLEVVQVERVRQPKFLERIAVLKPWAAVVVAFGQIFPSRLLEIPTVGCINLHGSLLPSFRGAAPIQASIAAGERVTGVTTMRMDEAMDSGPILLQREVEIGATETTPELSERLAEIGSELVVKTLQALTADTIEPRHQVEAEATYAPKLTKENGCVDWRMTAEEIYNRWRAYTPWPGLTASLHGQPIKIRECRPALGERSDLSPGSVLVLQPDLRAVCGEGTILILETLQRPGRGALAAETFARGERLVVGERFDLQTVADPTTV